MKNAIGLILALVAVLPWIAWTAEGDARPAPALETGTGTDAPDTEAPGDAEPPACADVETPEDVRELVTFMRRAGHDQVPVLRFLALSAEDPLVAGNAVRALGRLDAFAHDRELVALAEDPRLRLRQEAVRAIGLARDPAYVKKLIAILEHGDEQVRPIVIEALGHIGGVQARESLELFLNDPRSRRVDRTFALQALAGGALATAPRTDPP